MALQRAGSLLPSAIHLSLLLSLIPLPTLAQAEFPLTLLPIYTQATGYVGSCASSASSTFITSFGCDSFSNPGPCLCTNELSSSKIAYEISSCAHYIDLAHSDVYSATQLWRDYCRTNGGVSVIHEESKLQNIPLFTQVTGYVSSALTAATESLIQTFGCSEYTVAPCLCGDPGSSVKVWEEASTGAGRMLFGEESIAQLFSGSMLWSSFCQVNLATPASRTVVAPIKVDSKLEHDSCKE